MNRDIAAIERVGIFITSRSILAHSLVPAILSLGAVRACCGDAVDASAFGRSSAFRKCDTFRDARKRGLRLAGEIDQRCVKDATGDDKDQRGAELGRLNGA
jgi:hypothetical protein